MKKSAILLVMCLMTWLLGCDSGEETAVSQLTPPVPMPTDTAVSLTPTSTETQLPTTPETPPIATSTVHLESSLAAATPTSTPKPNELIDWANENLITFKTDGIYQIALDTGDSEIIVSRDEGWQLFSASLSYDGQEAVYWFVEDGTYQIWVLDTISGNTKQLLNIEENGITSVHGNWLGQGRFLEMDIWGEDENGVPLVVQWYLFDVQQGTIVGSANERPGKRICHLLAVSPRSNQAATWCSFDSQFEMQREYFVIEADGEHWQTTAPPEQLLFETLGSDGRQIWSPDGNYVLIPSRLNATLVYVPELQVTQLFENDSSSFNTFLSRFSPDGRWISYMHSICEHDNFCIKLIDIDSKSIVWESDGVFTPPVVGIYAWSPEERFFVIDAIDGTYIIDTFDFSVVKVLPSQLITTIEVAWLDN